MKLYSKTLVDLKLCLKFTVDNDFQLLTYAGRHIES